MKQRNLILMVVAVGCGLVAAFLTSQMTAKPGQQNPQVEIVVAAKELPPGTKFTKDSLKDLLKKRKVNPNDIPQNALMNEEELIDKQLVKTLRADDFVSTGDLGQFAQILPPEGKDLVTIKLPVEKVTPFVKPTSRVDLLGVSLQGSQKVRGRVLIPNMLVMAVDTETLPAPGAAGGKQTIQNVTLAASTDEARLIRMAEAAQVMLSFVLHGENDPGRSSKDWSIEQVIQWLNDPAAGQVAEKTDGGQSDHPRLERPTPTPAGPQAIKIWVPKDTIPAGTELTADLIDQRFAEFNWTPPVPENAVANIRDHIGKYIVQELYAGLPVPKNAIGNKPVRKAGPDEQPSPKLGGEKEPAEPAKKKPTYDQTFQSPNGFRTYRYEQQESGKWKLLGEVQPDGSVGPPQNAPVPAPAAPQPAPQPMGEPRITRA